MLLAYLARRRVVDRLHAAILARAQGNWLIARLLADRALAEPDLDPASLKGDWATIYAGNLERAGAETNTRWRDEFRPVLGVLAAAGVGPVLPLKLLCAASARLGGPDRPFRVRDILVDARGLVVRGQAGTEDEHDGLFHQTLADYLLDPASTPFGIEPIEPHRALAEAIAELAPDEAHIPADPLHRYAAVREAEHLWAIGKYGQVVACLAQRESAIPIENLKRWQGWKVRIESKLGPDHPESLRTRHNIALWTGAAGDDREELRLARELLPDRERVLGRDHRDTLATRHNIAACTGHAGEAREALRLFRELLPDQERVLGCDHPDTLATRNNIAHWTGRAGNVREALRLVRELLPDRERVLGRDHRGTLTTRNNIAAWTGEVGDAPGALRLFRELLPDMERVLGRDHPGTLTTRDTIAACTGRAGEAREALRLFRELLPDQERVLGRDHPDTLATRHNIAHWTGRAGTAREALRLVRELLPDQERVLGRDHPHTLATRHSIAAWTGEVSDDREALRLARAAAGHGAGAGPRPPRHAHHPLQHRCLDRRGGDCARGVAARARAAAGHGAGAGPRPPAHARHPQQHRGVDRSCGRCARGVAALSRAAAGPGAGAGPRPPRHARDTRPNQEARIGRMATDLAVDILVVAHPVTG